MDGQQQNPYQNSEFGGLARQDAEHLGMLAIAYYVVGGLTIAAAAYAAVYIIFGAMITHVFSTVTTQIVRSPGAPNPAGEIPGLVGGAFIVIGSIAAVIGATLGGLSFYAGRCLRARKNYTFIMVVAILNCIHVPLGTALGVVTIVFLTQPPVKDLFTRTNTSGL